MFLRSIVIMLSLSVFGFTAQATDKMGSGSITYVNQSGSTMDITVNKAGNISGHYKTALGCGIGKPRPLTGFKNGNAVTFTVNFQDCGSLTSWVGHIQKNGTIETIWTLARGNAKWDAKMTGVSVFKPAK